MATAENDPSAKDPARDAPQSPRCGKCLPQAESEVTADEEKFECPQPWFLALLTVAMSAMTSITVAGSLFFLLAAPEKVSPHCFKRENLVMRGFCTASTICFWTYPVVCCLFVVLVYAKNLVDQRTYYEFLLHKVVIGYGKNPAYKQPTVVALLIYALFAFSSLIWFHFSQTDVLASHVYSSLAYITPIISFLAVIFTSWSIQGKLITLPNFLQDYDWAVRHLTDSRCYSVEELHAGYLCLEHEMSQTTETFDTPRIVALVEHYAQTVHNTPQQSDDDAHGGSTVASPEVTSAHKSAVVKEKAKMLVTKAEEELVRKTQVAKEYVYWEVRLLFNPRLQDDRSQAFRNWALAYMVFVILSIIFSVYIFVCCLITCLEMERVLVPTHPWWGYMHHFSLRPDLGAPSSHSLKQMATSVAMSAMQMGSRGFHGTGMHVFRGSAPSHFQIGAAA